jgi:hypothetical protein
MPGRKVTKKMTANVVTPKLLEEALTASEARLVAKLTASEARLEAKLTASEARLEAKLTAGEARQNVKFGALETRLVELDARIDARFETQFVQLNLALAQLRIDIAADTLRSIQSVEESYRTRTAAVDDKYRDLPERVTALEHAVGIKRP